MKNRRIMIDVLLLLERMWWRLASLMVLFLLIIGRGLKMLCFGRRGHRLLTHKEIYANNIVSYWSDFGRSWLNRGIYIRRFGRHGSYRNIRIGQD